MSVINRINDQKNLIEENLKIMQNNSSGKHYKEFLKVKMSVLKKIEFLVNVIRNLKRKIKNYKNEA